MAKTAASEAALGRLHAKVVKIFGMSLDQVIEKLEAEEEAAFVVDPKLLNTIIKFLADNKIYSLAEEEVEDNPLAKKLAEIKAKSSTVIIPLVKEA